MSEMAETADDLVVIDRGRIIRQGTVTEVTAGHDSLEDAFLGLTDPAGDSPSNVAIGAGS